MSNHSPDRQPAGAPASSGGQFKTTASPVANLDLEAQPSGLPVPDSPYEVTDEHLDVLIDKHWDSVDDELDGAFDETDSPIYETAADALNTSGFPGIGETTYTSVDDEGYVEVGISAGHGVHHKLVGPADKSWHIITEGEPARKQLRDALRHVYDESVRLNRIAERSRETSRELVAMNIGEAIFQIADDLRSRRDLAPLRDAVERIAFPLTRNNGGDVSLALASVNAFQMHRAQELVAATEQGQYEHSMRRQAALEDFRDGFSEHDMAPAALQLAVPGTTRAQREAFLAGDLSVSAEDLDRASRANEGA